ncbi:hypothetical protein ACWJKU_01445 [Methylocaldum sp. MU1018]
MSDEKMKKEKLVRLIRDAIASDTENEKTRDGTQAGSESQPAGIVINGGIVIIGDNNNVHGFRPETTTKGPLSRLYRRLRNIGQFSCQISAKFLHSPAKTGRFVPNLKNRKKSPNPAPFAALRGNFLSLHSAKITRSPHPDRLGAISPVSRRRCFNRRAQDALPRCFRATSVVLGSSSLSASTRTLRTIEYAFIAATP